jgi:hypothetical protein
VPTYIDARELRTMLNDPAYGRARVTRELRESLDLGRSGKPGGMRLDHFSIRDLFEELIVDSRGEPCGRQVLRAWQRGSYALIEAAGAADTANFSLLVSQLFFDRLLAAYQSPDLIWPQLCSPRPTTRPFGQRVPGVANLGDVSQAVGENEDYPIITSSAHYTDVGATAKRGFRVPATRELFIADETGLVIQRLDQAGLSLGMNLEKRVIDVAQGAVNNYNRDGTTLNTYLTSGAYTNYSSTNSLVDYRSIETAELLFDAMSDPDTGEPILIGGRTLLVPTALVMTANRIVTATQVEHVDNQASATTFRTFSGNPIKSGINVLSSPYVKRRSSSASRWWYGDFKGAIDRYTFWDIEKDQRGRESPLYFEQDIVLEFKGTVNDFVQMMEPRKLTQNNT